MARVILKDRNFSTYDYDGINLEPTFWSGKAVGGYDRATIEASGSYEAIQDILRWLRFDLTIINDNNSKVWNGFVSDVVVYLGPISIGLSIDKMRNRVKILYDYYNLFAKQVSGVTDWIQSDDSVSRYGKRESTFSQSNIDATGAAQFAAIKLALLQYPVQTLTLNNQPISATITCRGWWSTNDWVYAKQLGGFEGYTDSGSATQPLGFGFTSNGVGFDGAVSKIHEINGYLSDVAQNWQLKVTGSTSNNTTFTANGATSQKPKSYTGSITFDANDDIKNADEQLAIFEARDMIKVTGSTSAGNNRYYFLNQAGSDHITVHPKTVTTQTGASTVTISRGSSIDLTASPTSEFPSLSSPYNTTVTAFGQKIYQVFTLSNNVPSWTFKDVLVQIQKIGSPTDNIVLELATKGSGDTYTTIESASISGTAVSTEMDWITFTFSNTNYLSYGTNYVLVLSRSGSNSPSDYYLVGLNEAIGYAGGNLRVYDGAAWQDRTVAADMPFQIFGEVSTSDQLITYLTENGQFYSSVYVDTPSGISSRQYNPTEQIAATYINDLLNNGTTSNKRYLAFVNNLRNCYIYEEPSDNLLDMPYVMRIDGSIVNRNGTKIEEGQLIFGQWVRLDLKLQSRDYIAKVDSFFVEECEYDARQQKLTPVPRNNDGVFKLTFLENR